MKAGALKTAYTQARNANGSFVPVASSSSFLSNPKLIFFGLALGIAAMFFVSSRGSS